MDKKRLYIRANGTDPRARPAAADTRGPVSLELVAKLISKAGPQNKSATMQPSLSSSRQDA